MRNKAARQVKCSRNSSEATVTSITRTPCFYAAGAFCIHAIILRVALQCGSGQATPAGGSAHAGLEYFTAGLAGGGSGCTLNPQRSRIKHVKLMQFVGSETCG